MASISADGRDLAINTLPFKEGMSVGLDVHVKTDGTYNLTLSYENKIPDDFQIWIKDCYLKDSTDVRVSNYAFAVNKADTNTFGNKRFRLKLSAKSAISTAPVH